MTASTLIFGWGNPSRGDDSLGPALLDRIEALLPANSHWGAVDLLTDFQLQVEHALDLEGRERVLFVDASVGLGGEPFRVSTLAPAPETGFTTHAIAPQAVMRVYADLKGVAPPPCQLLAIGGESFELGEPLSAAAAANLDAAVKWVRDWLSQPTQQ